MRKIFLSMAIFPVISILISNPSLCSEVDGKDKVAASHEAGKTDPQTAFPDKEYSEFTTRQNFDKVVDLKFLVEPPKDIKPNSWSFTVDIVRLLKATNWNGKQTLDAEILKNAADILILNSRETTTSNIFVQLLQLAFSKINGNTLQVSDSIVKLEPALGQHFPSVFGWLPIVFDNNNFHVRFDVVSPIVLEEAKKQRDKFNGFLDNLKGKNTKAKTASLNMLKKMFPGDKAKKIPDLHNNKNSTAQAKCVSVIGILDKLITGAANP